MSESVDPFEQPPLEPQKPPPFERALPGRTALISEQDYVDRELAVTRSQIERGVIKEYIDTRDGPTKGEGRLDRCERYARWRYRAYLDGEVASL